MKKLINYIFPPNTKRRHLTGRAARKLGLLGKKHPDIHYAEWLERSEPFLWSELDDLKYQPLISILVPVFNPPGRYLLPMVYSVVNQQGYENWELVLINASTEPKAIKMTQDCAQIDNRIKVIDTPENKGIAGNTNFGLAHCSGEYVGLLDHDDVLAPRALFEVARTLQTENRPELIYSDEDKLLENGEHRFDVHFKPDWSPQLFRHVNYLNHFMVIDKKLIDKVGGYRNGFEGSQDYDLFLRLIDRGSRVIHIPKILYHWRAAHGSTAQDFLSKEYLINAGVKALNEHLKRNDQKGKAVALKKQPGFYNIVYENKDSDRVAVILLPTDNLQQYNYLANKLIKNLKGSSLKTELFLRDKSGPILSESSQVKINRLSAKDKLDFLKKTLKLTDASLLVVFNAAVLPKNKKWLQELSAIVSQVDSIGIAAPVILRPDSDIIYDAGFTEHNGAAVGPSQGMPLGLHTYFGNTVWGRNVDYLSGRVWAARRSLLEKYLEELPQKEPAILNKAFFKSLRSDGYEVIIYPRVKMEYRGELEPYPYQSAYFTPNLMVVRYEAGLPRNINVPPVEKV